MIAQLMNEIIHADIKPQVFKVFLVATDYSVGFTAFVSLRSNDNGVSSIEVHADTPEEALTNLKSELIRRFGKCEHCGNYHNKES